MLAQRLIFYIEGKSLMSRGGILCRPRAWFRIFRKTCCHRRNSGKRMMSGGSPLLLRSCPPPIPLILSKYGRGYRFVHRFPILVCLQAMHMLSYRHGSSGRTGGIVCRVLFPRAGFHMNGNPVVSNPGQYCSTFNKASRANCFAPALSCSSGWLFISETIRSHSSSDIFLDFFRNSCSCGASAPWHS